ncbi:GNAT family N-acetyltransferase [Propionispora vibrioides]|uniref:Ribosomal-protein-alanine N-acetyltransferase n=1 Tax=Propionispora vibrioides TaxID=112903 RepID=A0A1H8XMR8_9FIRM|nr:GNAT family N-acetyltransferase [Propionispora vibrioides]SEP41053.1 ribosomal-protein-alanine N-acetyltransferase [Propionispora vibrioides]
MENINDSVLNKSDNIVLESVDKHIDQLVWVLNHDDCLIEALGSNNSVKISKQNFMETNKKWTVERCTNLFAIVLEKNAIGMIALSHQDMVNHTARIGYWLGSRYWNKGYASKAFRLILELARRKGLKYVSSTIRENNIVSRKIWEKYGAQSVLEDDKYSFVIDIEKIFPMRPR